MKFKNPNSTAWDMQKSREYAIIQKDGLEQKLSKVRIKANDEAISWARQFIFGNTTCSLNFALDILDNLYKIKYSIDYMNIQGNVYDNQGLKHYNGYSL